MDSTQEFQIYITEEAAKNVIDLITETGLDNSFLRVWVAGGGCSGLQYGMAFDTNIDNDDIKIVDKNIDIVVDNISAVYLSGSTIEYDENEMGGGFKVNNPNAQNSCGCGSSFNTEGDNPIGGCNGCHGSR